MINMQLKPKVSLLYLIDKQIKEKYGTFFLYMTTAARLLYAQKWRDLQIVTMEKWIELAEMANLTTLN